MTEGVWQGGDEISLFALATTLLRNRWRVVRWMVIGAVLAALVVFTRPAAYRASASFVPQGQVDQSRSGLASLAGQFGVTIPTSNQSLSSDFYARLLKSRELLTRVVRDTLVVEEMGRKRVAFADMFDLRGATAKGREEQGVRLLAKIVSASVTKSTGVVDFSVATKWPSVSVSIAMSLIDGINEFNRRIRQEQAAAERKFVEGRLAVAAGDLRSAEDRLEDFLRNNRQFASSPDLSFQRDRLQRDVTLKQQVFTSLTQSYEEVRIREVRDTPVITVVESPAVPTVPEPRRRVVGLLTGLILGAFVGAFLALTSGGMARRREQGNADAEELAGTIGELKNEMKGSVRWISRRMRP